MSIIVGLKRYKVVLITLVLVLLFSVSVFASEDTEELDYITTTRVNFRIGASTDTEIIKTFNPGTNITVLEYDEEWSKIVYNDIKGYISSTFIKEKPVCEIGEVELTPWSEARNVFTTYTPAKITDVRTGLVYYVQSFSNGRHADVETLTQEDTNIMFETYGRRWKWDPRPVWVTINGRTMAASINGMPHGGGTIGNNGMNGQVCIHFKDSSTHNGNASFTRDHQNGVMEAFNSR